MFVKKKARGRRNSLSSLLGASHDCGKVQQGWDKPCNISKTLRKEAHPVEQYLYLDPNSRKVFKCFGSVDSKALRTPDPGLKSFPPKWE